MTRRERQARADIRARGAALLIAVEAELDTMFNFDPHLWVQSRADADAAIADVRKRIDDECADLGVPEWARPVVHDVDWFRRGVDAVNERRAHLRGIAEQRVADLERRARLVVAADVDRLTGWDVTDAMPSFTAAELERGATPVGGRGGRPFRKCAGCGHDNYHAEDRCEECSASLAVSP